MYIVHSLQTNRQRDGQKQHTYTLQAGNRNTLTNTCHKGGGFVGTVPLCVWHISRVFQGSRKEYSTEIQYRAGERDSVDGERDKIAREINRVAGVDRRYSVDGERDKITREIDRVAGERDTATRRDTCWLGTAGEKGYRDIKAAYSIPVKELSNGIERCIIYWERDPVECEMRKMGDWEEENASHEMFEIQRSM